MESRRCLFIFSMMATTSASDNSTRSSTSHCFIAASNRRIAPRRAVSLARIAVFMSSVIFCLRLISKPTTTPETGAAGQSIEFGRKNLAHQALVMALHSRRQLALTLCGWLLVKFTSAQIGQQTGLFHGTLETTHRHFERLLLFNTYCCHEQTTFYKKIEGAILAKGLSYHNHNPVSYTHLRAHETDSYLVCRL